MPKINNNKPTIIDLFAGAGGLSLGAVRAGFNVVGAVELDSHAISTHCLNFPNTHHLALDITKLSGKTILTKVKLKSGQLDGLIGGPPCQGFSTMGRRCIDDPRNDLFGNFFRLVKELQPRFFLAENVPGLLNSRFDAIRKAAFSLIEKDYVLLPPLTVSAHEYGAATSRKRIFFIGYNPKTFINPLQLDEFKKLILSDEERIHVKYALLGLPSNINSLTSELGKIEINELKKIKSCFFHEYISGKIPDEVGSPIAISDYLEHQIVSGCIPTKHSLEVENRYKNLLYGEIDPISRSTKLNPEGFCPTLRAGTGPEKGSFQAVRPIHYLQPRVITPREAARLQGFPDWFVFHPTKWHSFRQIGNSVSPIVAEKLLTVLFKHL